MAEINETGKECCPEEPVTSVKISDEVVATIAAIAAAEIDGVGGMCGTKAGEIIEKFGKKNSAKGAKVEISDACVTIQMNILAAYGYQIPQVCAAVQAAVKQAVEGMTGLKVVEISITVHGIVQKDGEDFETEKEE